MVTGLQVLLGGQPACHSIIVDDLINPSDLVRRHGHEKGHPSCDGSIDDLEAAAALGLVVETGFLLNLLVAFIDLMVLHQRQLLLIYKLGHVHDLRFVQVHGLDLLLKLYFSDLSVRTLVGFGLRLRIGEHSRQLKLLLGRIVVLLQRRVA